MANAREIVAAEDQAEYLARELCGRLQYGGAHPEDAADCLGEVARCLSGKQGPHALESFRRTLLELMVRDRRRMHIG